MRDYQTPALDTFAERLAEGLTVAQIERQLNLPHRYGNAMLQRIRKRLGPQAV